MQTSLRPRLSLEFKVIVLGLLGIVVPYGLLLFFLPRQTEVYWAWVIAEPRSAMLVGGVYLAATLYYVIVMREDDWVQAQNGLGGLVVFSLVLLVATMAHSEAFRPYHLTTLVWLVLYYAGPLLFPILYRKDSAQAERSGSLPAEGSDLPSGWRTWLAARGVVYTGLALLGLWFAPALEAAWPWPIGALNLRVFMGQVAVVGWHGLMALRGPAGWRRHRLGLVLTAAIGGVHLAGLLIGPTPYELSSALGLFLPLMLAEWIATPAVLLSLHRGR